MRITRSDPVRSCEIELRFACGFGFVGVGGGGRGGRACSDGGRDGKFEMQQTSAFIGSQLGAAAEGRFVER